MHKWQLEGISTVPTKLEDHEIPRGLNEVYAVFRGPTEDDWNGN